MVMPLIGSDKAHMESLRPIAMDVFKGGLPVKLVKLSNMEVIETLTKDNIANGSFENP